MEKTNEILTIAGERVEVRYSGDVKDCCCRCPFSSDDACTVPDEQYAIPCRRYDKDGKYAYFVRAEEIEGTPQEVTLIPSNEDEDEAAEMAARRAYPYEGGTKGDICEASIPIFCKGFKAGIAYERERLMKEAVEGEVVGYDDGTGKFISLCEDLPDNTPYKVGEKVNVIIIKKEK